jgi:hypothetical protein
VIKHPAALETEKSENEGVMDSVKGVEDGALLDDHDVTPWNKVDGRSALKKKAVLILKTTVS